MSIEQAQQIGRNKTLKATTILFVILLALALFTETRGDFANGILFFLAAAINIHSLVILIILFGLTYFFGSRAGVEIIIQKKNILLISLKYAFLISAAISIYAYFISLSNASLPSTFVISIFTKTIICLLLVWLSSTLKLKKIN